MTPTFWFKLSLHLALTLQLRQFIKLLQQSILEFNQKMNVFQENSLLEITVSTDQEWN